MGRLVVNAACPVDGIADRGTAGLGGAVGAGEDDGGMSIEEIDEID